ncbi:hypothetical protein ABFY48_09605 [Lysinibacillus pakistanensis]|uniref:hypothetical protein n=1 Tax=Lysinibacillus pakistanensis TaxID=759811 RepID=UPI003D2AA1D7
MSCPNCLANNSYKKVHRDGSVVEICEYCNSIKEDTNTIIELIVTPENNFQNKIEDENDLPKIVIYLAIVIFVVEMILIVHWSQ